MLRNKTDYRCDGQSSKDNYAPVNPFGFHNCFLSELVAVSQFLKVTTDYVSGDTAITTGQITRAHQTLTYETTFGKVLGLGFAGHKTGISRRSRSSKSSHGTFFGFDRQRVFGVDAPNSTPVKFGSSEDVIHDYFRFRNQNAGIPKQQPGKVGETDVHPGFSQKQRDGFSCQCPQSNQAEQERHYRHDAARFGVQDLKLHVSSLTHPASKAGAR